MKVNVIGLGYVGLPTAVLISKCHHVNGVDINHSVVNKLNLGQAHIVEPGLQDALVSAISNKRFIAGTSTNPADVHIIAVPTPFKENKEPDLRFVTLAVEAIAPVLEPGNLIILESTSPVGTTHKISKTLSHLRQDLNFPDPNSLDSEISIAYCPERVLPGNALFELLNNDRIIGGLSLKCAQKAADFYETFVFGACEKTDSKTAEMCKLVENSYRDVNLAFANEISMICDEAELDVWELLRLTNLHPRVNILQPGPGVGGHCIPVDPWFLIDSFPGQSSMLQCARKVNQLKETWVLEKIRKHLEQFPYMQVAFLGLSYKPDIDDIRESPAIRIVNAASEKLKINSFVVEPLLNQLPNTLKNDRITKCDLDSALSNANLLVFLVGHQKFKNIDPMLLKNKNIIDVCGVFS